MSRAIPIPQARWRAPGGVHELRSLRPRRGLPCNHGYFRLSKIPALAVVCQSPFGNNLQRQLVAAGLKQTKAVSLEGCAHWIYEENPDETLAALTEFLGAARNGP